MTLQEFIDDQVPRLLPRYMSPEQRARLAGALTDHGSIVRLIFNLGREWERLQR